MNEIPAAEKFVLTVSDKISRAVSINCLVPIPVVEFKKAEMSEVWLKVFCMSLFCTVCTLISVQSIQTDWVIGITECIRLQCVVLSYTGFRVIVMQREPLAKYYH